SAQGANLARRRSGHRPEGCHSLEHSMNRGVAVYLTLAFGLAWAAQIAVAVMVRSGGDILASPSGALLVTAIALMWPPALGAYVARRWVERSGFADAGLRWPPRRYLLVAWFGPALLALVTMLLS